MVRTKVFVGNLSFKTQEADLTKEFEAAGKVATANIISRGSRSLGYGFVEMESEEEANKAVQLLNKKLIDEREINVEVAKPREENAAAKEGQAPRARRTQRPRAQGQAGGANNNANGTSEGEGQGGDAAPRRRRPSTRRPRRRTNNGEDGSPSAGGDNNSNNNGTPKEPRQPRQPRQPRAPKPEGERAPKIAAPNTLFVANLPFTVDDDALSKIFAGLNLKSAKVVRKRNNRSKGFGFVEFNSEDEQKKALTAIDKKSVEGRELIVKVAITASDVAAAGENATNNKDTAAAATTAANPTTAAASSPAVAKKEATPASPKPTTQN